MVLARRLVAGVLLAAAGADRRGRRGRRPSLPRRRAPARAPRPSTRTRSPPPTPGRSTTPPTRPSPSRPSSRAATPGRPRGARPSSWARGRSPSSSSAASPTSRATSAGLQSLAGLQRVPGGRGHGPVDRVLDRQLGLRARGRGGSLAGRGQGAGAPGPALPRARTDARRGCGRRHRRHTDLRSEVAARRPLRPRPGLPVPGRGGLGERKGAAHGRPSTSPTPSGARRCGPRPPRRPSPSGPSAPSDGRPTPGPSRGRGKMGPSPTWPSRRSPRHRAGPPGE